MIRRWEIDKPSVIKDYMNRYRFYFKKDFGQNFLIDDAAVERIVDALELSGQDIVLEVAPDRALTELLVQRLIL